VLARLHEDTRHKLGRLDRDQQDLEALVRWCEEGLNSLPGGGGDANATMASSPADHTLRLAMECKDEYEAVSARVDGMVREVRTARDMHGDVGGTMSQVETKLSTGFDLLQLVDGNAEELAHSLSVRRAPRPCPRSRPGALLRCSALGGRPRCRLLVRAERLRRLNRSWRPSWSTGTARWGAVRSIQGPAGEVPSAWPLRALGAILVHCAHLRRWMAWLGLRRWEEHDCFNVGAALWVQQVSVDQRSRGWNV